MQNAIPVFIDIEKETLGLDPDLLEKALTPATKAIIAVHILGYPSKIDLIREFANKHNLILIEDASHAPGAKLNGKQIGTFGDLAVYSLQQRKAISTGDGGVVCTNNSIFADKIRKQRSFGDHELSYNYRMTEFAAALGRIGLEKLDDDNQNREKCALFLHEYLKDHDWIKVRLARPFEKGVYYAVALEINLNDEMCNKLLNWCLDFGLPMRKLFSPLNKHPHFFNSPVPARGLPWQHPTYKGENGKLPYSEQHFPVAYEYCHGRILELYTHPGTKDHHLEAFGVLLQELYKMIPDGNSRPNWSS
jgi:dTDP-4-amino-4,6-dideoxygalactose transaminase